MLGWARSVIDQSILTSSSARSCPARNRFTPRCPGFFHGPDGTTIAYHKNKGDKTGKRAPGLIFLGGFMSDMTGTKAFALETHAQAAGLDFLRFD